MKKNTLYAVCLAVVMIPHWGSSAVDGNAKLAEIEKKLIGTWPGVSGHWGKENSPPETHSFIFRKNHQVEFTIGNQTFSGTYSIDVETSPFHMDLTFSHRGEKVTTQTIFDFPEKDQLCVAEPDPNWRRKEFNPGMTFKKEAGNKDNSLPASSSGE